MADALAAALAIVATVAVYAAAQRLYARVRHPLLNPLLVAITTLIVLLWAMGIGYADYDRGGRLISFWLGPAVVALGVPLHAVCRSQTRTRAFRSSTRAVAMPISVMPMMKTPRSSLKCSDHTSIRGLYSRVNAPEPGTIDPMSVPLNRLQSQQANARLLGSLVPRCLRLRM